MVLAQRGRGTGLGGFLVKTERLRNFALLGLLALSSLFAFRAYEAHRAAPSLEKMWSDIKFAKDMPKAIFADAECNSATNRRLACINAINSAALKINLTFSSELGLRPLDPQTDNLTEKAYIQKWNEYLKNNSTFKLDLYEIWKVLIVKPEARGKESQLTAAAINGYFSIVADPHSYLVPLDYYTKVIAKAENQALNFGFVLRKHVDGARIHKVHRGSAAEKAHLQKHDTITSINGISLKKLSLIKIQELLKSQGTSEVVFDILRNGQVFTKALSKAPSTIYAVESRMLNQEKGIGLLVISKFAAGICEKSRFEIEKLKSEGLRTLVLDMRDNGGGSIDEAACLIGLFVPKDELLFELHHLNSAIGKEVYYSKGDRAFEGPVGVLVNATTASSAELVAGSLRDLRGSVIIGQRTFGKGSFQQGEVWPSNEKVAYFSTRGFFYLPSGRTPQLKGISPDVEVDSGDTAVVQREEDLYFNPFKAPELTIEDDMVSQAETVVKRVAMLQCGLGHNSTLDYSLDSQDAEISEYLRYLNCNISESGDGYDRNKSF
jgi:carboxyl-terminal processing protease